jgi:hypothetical protein
MEKLKIVYMDAELNTIKQEMESVKEAVYKGVEILNKTNIRCSYEYRDIEFKTPDVYTDKEIALIKNIMRNIDKLKDCMDYLSVFTAFQLMYVGVDYAKLEGVK